MHNKYSILVKASNGCWKKRPETTKHCMLDFRITQNQMYTTIYTSNHHHHYGWRLSRPRWAWDHELEDVDPREQLDQMREIWRVERKERWGTKQRTLWNTEIQTSSEEWLTGGWCERFCRGGVRMAVKNGQNQKYGSWKKRCLCLATQPPKTWGWPESIREHAPYISVQID